MPGRPYRPALLQRRPPLAPSPSDSHGLASTRERAHLPCATVGSPRRPEDPSLPLRRSSLAWSLSWHCLPVPVLLTMVYSSTTLFLQGCYHLLNNGPFLAL